MKTYLVGSEERKGSVGLTIRDVQFPSATGQTTPTNLVMAAQLGDQFGIYSDLPEPAIQAGPSRPSELTFGLIGGLLQYSGDAKHESSPQFGEMSLSYPVTDAFSIVAAFGKGNLQGYDFDLNGGKWSFVSSLYYLNVMPALQIMSAGPAALLVEAGVGGSYLKSANDAASGLRLQVPLAAEVDLGIFGPSALALRAGYTITSGDLDGLRKTAKADNYLGFSVGITNLLLHLSSAK